MKKIVYIDMDNVLVDFKTGIDKLEKQQLIDYEDNLDEAPGIFSLMKPMPHALESVTKLAGHFDVYVLSTSPWKNPSAWTDKIKWIQYYFGEDNNSVFYKRLILSHHKNLNKGDYLIDDRDKNGADKFEGELIRFGSDRFPNWHVVSEYLLGTIK